MCTVHGVGDIYLLLIYSFTCLARDVEADSVLGRDPGGLGEQVFALMASVQRREEIGDTMTGRAT